MMNRPVALRNFQIGWVVSACFLAIGVEASEQQRQPNVLFILADDVTYSTLGCYGGKNVKTPNIDSLAREGVRFTRAYCAMSMCTPFRAELYTGLYRVDKDPYEMDNLANNPKYNEVKKRLRIELDRWMKTQGDPRIAMDSIAAHAANRKVVTKSPRVLIIGDSISIGYTPYVTQMLKNEAVIKHHKGNAEHTGTGLKKLERWIGDTQWDVIHFNWGLWDLCYRHPESKVQGHRDKVNGTVTTSLVQYEKNLEELVIRLKMTNAKLIWAHTTTVPEKEAGRFVGDDKTYNDVAARIMKKHNVTVNDLNRLTGRFPAELFTQPGNVHYTKQGYQRIARQVAGKILTSLKGEQKDSGVKN